VFGARLLQLQGLDAQAYAAQATESRLRTVVLPATRGAITDIHGHALAMTVDGRTVYADPRHVTDPVTEAATLAPLLNLDESAIEAQLRHHSSFAYVDRGITPELGARVSSLNLPGIGLLDEPRRIYPNGDLAANVLGFVGIDGSGLDGLEYSDNSMLAGKPGRQTFQIGADGRAIPSAQRTEQPAVPGSKLVLTLDRDIQWKAQRAITRQVRATKSLNGTVIVMNPRNGHILALATAPTFNPSDPTAYPSADRGDRPIIDIYEPGSTNKVITFAAGLQTHAITPLTPITVPPTLHRSDHTFHDAEVHGTLHLTATGVLAKSSNIGTMLVSERVGAHRLYHFLRAFGFGRPTGVGLPGENGGILAPVDLWSGTQRYTIAFGQGVSVTALQVASVYSTVANDGVRVEPRVVAGEVGPDGHFHAAPTAPTHRVISRHVSAELRRMLETVTSNEGTAPAARISGYRVAGKTGTSQRVDPTCSCYRGYTSSFVGFAPADNPKLLVEVVLQAPQIGHFGGLIAAPVFHDVMSFALQNERVAPTGTHRPRIRLETR
jgi:cell division protein FtsI (penicillin-binding protein 3)